MILTRFWGIEKYQLPFKSNQLWDFWVWVVICILIVGDSSYNPNVLQNARRVAILLLPIHYACLKVQLWVTTELFLPHHCWCIHYASLSKFQKESRNIHPSAVTVIVDCLGKTSLFISCTCFRFFARVLLLFAPVFFRFFISVSFAVNIYQKTVLFIVFINTLFQLQTYDYNISGNICGMDFQFFKVRNTILQVFKFRLLDSTAAITRSS